MARMQVCGQAQPGKEAFAHLQQSDAIEWGRPVSGPPDPEVRRLRRMSRYVPAVIRKIVGASNCGQHAHYTGPLYVLLWGFWGENGNGKMLKGRC